MGICGFGVESGGDMIRILPNCDIKEVGLLMGEVRSEFDGSVERINVFNESMEAFFFPSPDEENVIDVAPPNPWSAGG